MTKKEGHRSQILREIVAGAALAAIAVITPAAMAQEHKPTLMLYGDSLMAGLGLPPEQCFAAQLGAALSQRGRDVEIINASVSGDTSADGLARLEWSLGEKPDAVVLELGANDMLQGLPPAGTRENLTAILERLQAENLPVLLAGMRASPALGQAYVAAYDRIFPELAQEYGTELLPFFLEGVALDRNLNQADGIHPNAKGVAIVVASIVPYVEQLLDAIADR